MTVTATDDDGGSGSDSVTVNVLCVDPIGDVSRKAGPDSDLIAGAVANDATTLTIVLGVAGTISGDFQYRVYLNGGTLKYNGSKLTGPASLTASVDGGSLTLQVGLADLGLGPGDRVELCFETQGGVEGSRGEGKPDRMPDAGLVGYVVR